jgi:hypothetical protein
MTELDIRAVLVDILATIEPDARGATFSVDADLQDALCLDDDDLARFGDGVVDAFGLRITPHERGRLRSLSGAIGLVRCAQPVVDVAVSAAAG